MSSDYVYARDRADALHTKILALESRETKLIQALDDLTNICVGLSIRIKSLEDANGVDPDYVDPDY